MMPTKPEKVVENWAFSRFAKLKWPCLKQALYTGIPDRLILAENGRAAFIEFKSLTGSRGPLQDRWRKKLSRLGYPVRLCRTKADVEALIELLSDEIAYRREVAELRRQ